MTQDSQEIWYPYKFTVDKKDWLLLWGNHEGKDVFKLDDNSNLLIFESKEGLKGGALKSCLFCGMRKGM